MRREVRGRLCSEGGGGDGGGEDEVSGASVIHTGLTKQRGLGRPVGRSGELRLRAASIHGGKYHGATDLQDGDWMGAITNIGWDAINENRVQGLRHHNKREDYLNFRIFFRWRHGPVHGSR